MTLVDPDSQKWEGISTRVSDGTQSKQTVSLDTEINAAYLTLEMMVVYSCKAYPSSGNITFDSTVLRGGGGEIVQIPWTPMVNHSECSQSVKHGGPSDPVTISWDPLGGG